MSNRNPHHGQKVTPGGDSAPTTQEAAGAIAPDSLAAQSVRSGGAFAANRGADPEPSHSSAKGTQTTSGGSGTRFTVSGAPAQAPGPSGDSALQGGAAPSYVNAQFVRDDGGPHGKNLHEGGFAGSGPGNSINAEPGSKKDPARLAELGHDRADRSAGPRQGQVDNEQPYAALGRETSS